MEPIEYKIKMSGDFSQIEKAVKQTKAKVKSIEDDVVTIQFDYDGNQEALNKEVKKMMSKLPDFEIQLKYDINQKALERELKKHRAQVDFKVALDKGDYSKQMKDMVKDLEDGIQRGLSNADIAKKMKKIFAFDNMLKGFGHSLFGKYDFEEDIVKALEKAGKGKLLDKFYDKVNIPKLKLFEIDESMSRDFKAGKASVEDFSNVIDASTKKIDAFKKMQKELIRAGAQESLNKIDTQSLLNHVQDLEAQVDELTQKNAELVAQIRELSKQNVEGLNKSLKETNETLDKTIGKVRELNEEQSKIGNKKSGMYADLGKDLETALKGFYSNSNTSADKATKEVLNKFFEQYEDWASKLGDVTGEEFQEAFENKIDEIMKSTDSVLNAKSGNKSVYNSITDNIMDVFNLAEENISEHFSRYTQHIVEEMAKTTAAKNGITTPLVDGFDKVGDEAEKTADRVKKSIDEMVTYVEQNAIVTMLSGTGMSPDKFQEQYNKNPRMGAFNDTNYHKGYKTYGTLSATTARTYSHGGGTIYQSTNKVPNLLVVNTNGADYHDSHLPYLGDNKDEQSKRAHAAYNVLRTLAAALEQNDTLKKYIKPGFVSVKSVNENTGEYVNGLSIQGDSMLHGRGLINTASLIAGDISQADIDKYPKEVIEWAQAWGKAMQEMRVLSLESERYGFHSTDTLYEIALKKGYGGVKFKNTFDPNISEGHVLTDDYAISGSAAENLETKIVNASIEDISNKDIHMDTKKDVTLTEATDDILKEIIKHQAEQFKEKGLSTYNDTIIDDDSQKAVQDLHNTIVSLTKGEQGKGFDPSKLPAEIISYFEKIMLAYSPENYANGYKESINILDALTKQFGQTKWGELQSKFNIPSSQMDDVISGIVDAIGAIEGKMSAFAEISDKYYKTFGKRVDLDKIFSYSEGDLVNRLTGEITDTTSRMDLDGIVNEVHELMTVVQQYTKDEIESMKKKILINSGNGSYDDFIRAFNDLNNMIHDIYGKSIKSIGDIVDENGVIDFSSEKFDDELKSELIKKLRAVGLNIIDTLDGPAISSEGLIKHGYVNKGGFIGNSFVDIVRDPDHPYGGPGYNITKTEKLMDITSKAKQLGANVGEILGYVIDPITGLMHEFQSKVEGENIASSTEWVHATAEQIKKLVNDIIQIQKAGGYVDIDGDNILYDSKKGFSIIDLGHKKTEHNTNNPEEIFNKYLKPMLSDYGHSATSYNFENKYDDAIKYYAKDKHERIQSGVEETVKSWSLDEIYASINKEADELVDKASKDIEELNSMIKGMGEEANLKVLVEEAEELFEYLEKGQITVRDYSIELSKICKEIQQLFGYSDKDMFPDLDDILLDDNSVNAKIKEIQELFGIFKKSRENNESSIDDLDIDVVKQQFTEADQEAQKFENTLDELNEESRDSAVGNIVSNEDIKKIEEFEEKLRNILQGLGGNTWAFSPGQSEELGNFMEEVAKFCDIDPKNKDLLYAIFEPLLEFKNLNYEETVKEICELRDALESFSMVDNNEISRLVQNIKDAVPDDPDWLIDGEKIQKDLKEAWNKLGDALGLSSDETSELSHKNLIGQHLSNDLSALMIQKEALKMKANKTVDSEDVANVEREIQAERELVEVEERLSEARRHSDDTDAVDRERIENIERQVRARRELNEVEEENKTRRTTADASQNVDAETDSLNRLKEALLEVIELIDRKTQGFLDEEILVKSAVENESSIINSLVGQLELIKGVLDDISNITKGSHKGLGNALEEMLNMVRADDFGSMKDKLYEFRDAIKELHEDLSTMTLPEGNFFNQIKKLLEDKDALQNMADIAKNFKKVESAMEQAEKASNPSTDTKQVQNMVDSITSKISGYENFKNKVLTQGQGLPGIQEIAEEIDRIVRELEDAKATVNDINIDNIRHSVKELTDDFNRAKSEFGNITKMDNVVKNSTVQAELNKLNQFMQKNSGASREWKDQLEECRNELKRMAEQATVLSSDFEPVKAQIQKIEAAMREAGETGISMWDRMKRSLKSQIAQQAAMYLSLQDFIRYMRELVSTVTEVDTALTELRKVSDASDTRLAQSFSKSAETAKELGATISNVISSTSDWARMGYDIDQAEELARVTTLYQNVGDNIDQQTASENLISALQGFQLSADEAESVIDRFNEVANNYAIDAQGIGEALKRSAASFNAAGTDISKATALVTATNTVLQDPATVGTLWKTMSARIRGAKTELQELGEEEDEFTQSTSKLQGLVKSLTGFDIMKDKDTFKDIYDIIIGIGEAWPTLKDIDKASLGEALAGMYFTRMYSNVHRRIYLIAGKT